MLPVSGDPTPRFRITWRLVGLAAVVVPNLIWGAALCAAVVHGGESVDWWTFEQAASRVGGGGELYEWLAPGDTYGYAYRYSPLFAWLMVPVTGFGIAAWRMLHLAVLALLPWRLALLTLLTWPFWEDMWHANVMTFAFVFGYLALRGNRVAAAAFLVLAMMVPRPLMLPVLIWIAWRRPEWRGAGIAVAALMAAMTVATGLAVPFLDALSRSAGESYIGLNPLPSRFIGFWWLVIGAPLGAWLVWRGRLGWASLAMSPYLWPYHGLMLLLETSRWRALEVPPAKDTLTYPFWVAHISGGFDSRHR